MDGFGLQGVRTRLLALDDQLTGVIRARDKVPVVIVGSAALMLSGLAPTTRFTRDIDFIEAPFEALGPMRDLDMNNAAMTFSLRMPSGWRERTHRVGIDTETIEVLVPSAADVLIMKLDSGRDQDLEDVRRALERRKTLRDEVEEILADPLEVMVNLSGSDWQTLADRWEAITNGSGEARSVGTDHELGTPEESHDDH